MEIRNITEPNEKKKKELRKLYSPDSSPSQSQGQVLEMKGAYHLNTWIRRTMPLFLVLPLSKRQITQIFYQALPASRAKQSPETFTQSYMSPQRTVAPTIFPPAKNMQKCSERHHDSINHWQARENLQLDHVSGTCVLESSFSPQ